MARQVLATGAQPCVWMCAGVLRYRLCTHDYDCDHCPLDAALRGDGLVRAPRAVISEPTPIFPDDRRYAAGHTWLQPVVDSDEGAWRLGIDAFAAAMVADARVVSWDGTPWVVQPGDTVCTLDVGLGLLSVRSPVRARILRDNHILRLHPKRVVTAPYDAGWLVELVPLDDRDLDDLVPATAAREAAVRDLRSFRRTVALSLLREPDGDRVGDSTDPVVRDLRWLLGGNHYLEFLGDLVH